MSREIFCEDVTFDNGEIYCADVTLGQTVIVKEGPEEYTGPVTVTPTEAQQTLQTADKLVKSNISVEAIPSEYIMPTGNMEITENGQYDITDNASVTVDIPIPPQRVITGTFIGNGTADVSIPNIPFDPDVVIAYSPDKLADFPINATWYFYLGPMVALTPRRTTSGWGASANVDFLPKSSNRPGKTYADGILTLLASGSIYQFANGATYNYILVKLSE